MSIDRANCFRVPEDYPVSAVVSAIAGAQPNTCGGTALAREDMPHTPLARALGLLFPGHAQAAAKVGVAGGAVFGQPLLAAVAIPAHGRARKQHARRHGLPAYPVHQAARQVHAAAPQQGLARLGPRLL